MYCQVPTHNLNILFIFSYNVHLRIIGCLCYASSSEIKGDKFEGKGIRCVLVNGNISLWSKGI